MAQSFLVSSLSAHKNFNFLLRAVLKLFSVLTHPYPPFTDIHIEFPLMLTLLWPKKNRVSEVGQHSGQGPGGHLYASTG